MLLAPTMDLKELKNQDTSELFASLLKVMEQLRGPSGCPWDKKQSHSSLIPYLLEETYEVIGAIDSHNPKHLSEELGDLLLQIVFHAQIGSEEKTFEMKEILHTLIEKLVRRHPHVFAEEKVEGAEEAIHRWEKIKASEKKAKELLLDSIPVELPALLRAYRIGSKVSKLGFDWPNLDGVLRKIEEELKELHQEMGEQNTEAMEEEFGDLLFTIAQAARFLKLNPEEALRKSTLKFQKRFDHMERGLLHDQKDFSDCSPEELERLWEQAKSFTDSVKKL
jgi:MazG family protein